jgi:2-dehydropantoate 2-reductase
VSNRIAILGCGAIGSSVGADMTDAGEDVTLIDQWPAHVDAMKADGLRVVMPDLDLHVNPKAMHLFELATDKPEFDVVFLAAKSYDTAWLTQLIEPYLKPDGMFVGLQNGMNDELICSILGPERVVPSVVELSAEIWEPGEIKRDTTRQGTWFGVGELDGTTTPRVEEAARLLGHAARVGISDNILGAKWTKLLANSMTMGPFSLFGLKNWDAAKLPGIFEISVAIGRETVAVGAAQGLRLQPIFGLTAEEFAGAGDEVLITAMKTLLEHVGEHSMTATVQDAHKGRRTEIESITGTVVRKGREYGVPTPYNDAVLEIALEISNGKRTMDPANLDLLKDRLNIA